MTSGCVFIRGRSENAFTLFQQYGKCCFQLNQFSKRFEDNEYPPQMGWSKHAAKKHAISRQGKIS